jgi:hypothetical protein
MAQPPAQCTGDDPARDTLSRSCRLGAPLLEENRLELSARSLRSARWPLMTSAIATLLTVLCQPVAAETFGPTEALNANAATDTSCDISPDVAVEPWGAVDGARRIASRGQRTSQ